VCHWSGCGTFGVDSDALFRVCDDGAGGFTGTTDVGVGASPRSVAVIGASADPAKVGNAVLTNLLRGAFTGPV